MPQSSFAMVFPGQGSQKVGMLQDLATQYPLIEATFAEASSNLDCDLWQLCADADRMNQTEWTQPLLLTASIAIWRVWQAQGGAQPQFLAGHSLGEYSALVAADAMGLPDAVRLVQRRGQLMQQAVPQGVGSMAAILGLDDATVIALCDEVSTNGIGRVQAANFNAPGQVVIAGHTEAVAAVNVAAKAQGGKAMSLPVSVPSHCALMDEAAAQFSHDLNRIALQMPAIPVIHNVNAAVAHNVDELKQLLVKQLSQSVQWSKTMAFLQQHNVSRIVECGNGTVLTNLAKRLSFVTQALPTDTPARFEQALHGIQAL